MNTGPINANNNIRLRIDPRDLFPKNFLRLGFAVDIIGGEDSAAPGVVASGPPAVVAPSTPPAAVVAPSTPPAVVTPSTPPAVVASSTPPAVVTPSTPPAVVADSGPSVGPCVGNGGAVTGARVVPGSANAVWPSCISSSLTLIISSIAELIFFNGHHDHILLHNNFCSYYCCSGSYFFLYSSECSNIICRATYIFSNNQN